jgi:hypothetical protein
MFYRELCSSDGWAQKIEFCFDSDDKNDGLYDLR